MSGQYYEGVGRRKESTARVRIMQGEGKFVVNEKPLADYFTPWRSQPSSYLLPRLAETRRSMTLRLLSWWRCFRPNLGSQLGLARAFTKLNPDYVSALARETLLTRDPRVRNASNQVS
jgi:small subunit ribosomal protein S9